MNWKCFGLGLVAAIAFIAVSLAVATGAHWLDAHLFRGAGPLAILAWFSVAFATIIGRTGCGGGE
jgi:hypothetical protein